MNGIGRKIKGANNTAGCTTGNDEDVGEQRRIRHRRSKSDKNVDVDKLIERNARNEFADRPTGSNSISVLHIFEKCPTRMQSAVRPFRFPFKIMH